MAESMYELCLRPLWTVVWLVVDYMTLATGGLSNAALLVLFLRARKTLSASQVLGINQVIMNLIYLTIIPVDLISRTLLFSTFNTTSTSSDVAVIVSGNQTHTGPEDLRKILNTFVLVGTPLLLACMCVERHLAVSRPVLYMKIRERKYHVTASAVVWVITVGFSVISWFIRDILIIILSSIFISFLFVVMLWSLGTMVQSLRQKSPAHQNSVGNTAHPDSPQKRQAVQSLLIVVVAAILVYLPVLALSPFILFMLTNRRVRVSGFTKCNVFLCSLLFPRFGVLIGPLFFFSKAKQMFKKRSNSG